MNRKPIIFVPILAEKPLWQGYYVVQRATTLEDGGMTLIRRMLSPSVAKEPGKGKRDQ